MSFNNLENTANYKNLQSELIKNLSVVKNELDTNANTYHDVLAITFESKVRLVLSIMKVSYLIILISII